MIIEDKKLTKTFLDSLPKNSRLIALDVGTKRIGVAICDDSKLIATPKLIINCQGNERDFTKIAEIIKESSIAAIVVGLPINMDESASAMSEFVRKFVKNLDQFLENKLVIFLFDERLSSFEAREIRNSSLSNKKSRKKNKFYDDVAASLILEHFLQQFF